MNLQVDLYKDAQVLNSMELLSKQIETRGFKLEKDFSPLKEINAELFDRCVALQQQKREYTFQAGGAKDSLFTLELLGVGAYCKQYTVVIDFSYALDYVLHRLSGCSINNIHKMDNYDEISFNIMNLNFRKLHNINFSVLFVLDDELAKYLNNLLQKVSGEYSSHNKIINEFCLQFYQEIIREVTKIKDYCMIYVKNLYANQVVYRSKSYAASVATSSVPINEELELIMDGYETYKIPIKSYACLEYAKQEGELLWL